MDDAELYALVVSSYRTCGNEVRLVNTKRGLQHFHCHQNLRVAYTRGNMDLTDVGPFFQGIFKIKDVSRTIT